MVKKLLLGFASVCFLGTVALAEPHHPMHHHYFKRYYKNRGLERAHRWHHGRHWHKRWHHHRPYHPHPMH